MLDDVEDFGPIVVTPQRIDAWRGRLPPARWRRGAEQDPEACQRRRADENRGDSGCATKREAEAPQAAGADGAFAARG